MNIIKKILLLSLIFLTTISCNCNNNEQESIQSYKNLIIIIGDGMGKNHIEALQESTNEDICFTSWNKCESNTSSFGDNGIFIIHTTDSAASGTALATGVVTHNGYIGKDKNGNDVSTILDYAKSLEKSTGIVTTDTLYGATPAAFSSHSISRGNTDEILTGIATSNVDILISNYSDTTNNYKDTFINNGYSYYTDVNNVDLSNTNKLIYQPIVEESNGNVSLKEMVEVSINILNKNENGYCLMIEQAYIDKYSHNNDFSNMLKAIQSLNNTINYLNNIVSDDTFIIVTADHETGGLNVSSKYKLSSNTNINDKVLYYHFNKTGHTNRNVFCYTNKFYDFSTLNYYNSSSLIKNSDIYYISKSVLN